MAVLGFHAVWAFLQLWRAGGHCPALVHGLPIAVASLAGEHLL